MRVYANHQSNSRELKMLECCQHERATMSPLPFERYLSFDSYDGPLAGYALCSICHKCFHFRVLEWETYAFCRVFGFASIDMNFDRVEKDLKHWTENTKLVLVERRSSGNDDLPIPETTDYIKQIELSASRLEYSHLCISESYLDSGYWREMKESDKGVTDWCTYLGVVYDEDNLTFHLENFHTV